MGERIMLSTEPDFRLGVAAVCPSRCELAGPGGAAAVEPRVMQVLVALARAGGGTVSHAELLESCWEGRIVGSDAMHRAIAQLRLLARGAGQGSFDVQTVRKVGYRLDGGLHADRPPTEAVAHPQAARQVLRMAEPAPDLPAIEQLRQAAHRHPGDAGAWSGLALLLRHAAEYAEPAMCAAFVRECEAAVGRALAIDPCDSDALVARAGLAPLFGGWLSARRALGEVLARDPQHPLARHDFSMIEMSTGRSRAAARIVEELLEADPLSPALLYKRIYHLWTLNRIDEMDRVADRALALWPRHAAIWFARLWSLAGTARARAALRQVEDAAARPPMPPPAVAALTRALSAMSAWQEAGGGPPPPALTGAIVRSAENGPAQALAALIQLGILGAANEAIDVARGYYLRRGDVLVHGRHSAEGWSVTDQHRKVTQALFIPAFAAVRRDARFAALCAEIGLADYWRAAGVVPDHLDDRVAG